MINRPIYVGYAEDHLTMRESLIGFLQTDEQIKIIVEADNGRQLLEKMEAMTILPHVCLIDIRMPEMGGLELLNELKRRWPTIKTIVLSGFSEEMTVLAALIRGAKGYLAKDSPIADVVLAIKTVFAGQYYYSPQADESFFEKAKRDTLWAPVWSDIELEFLGYICMENVGYAEIATRMGISRRRVDVYCERLFKKLGVHSRLGLAIAAKDLGITGYPEKAQN